MNIYFACSITGGRRDERFYQLIIDSLLAAGHTTPTAHLSQPDVLILEATVDAKEVYTRDIGWIEECQALIAEVSTPSHGVGYEIAFALSLGKPVLCCFQRGIPVSKMITGNTNPTLQVHSYVSPEEAVKVVYTFLDQLDVGSR